MDTGMVLDIVLLLAGFALLIKGADFFVDGASGIARMLKVPPLLIGLTIVGFGTSAPEATVSLLAALNGTGDIALGNAVGSNILNITLVIGLTAILLPLKVESETVRKEIPFTLLASVVLLIMASDAALQGTANVLSRSDGIILLLFLGLFMYYIIEVARKSRENAAVLERQSGGQTSAAPVKGLRQVLYATGGLAGIIAGGSFVVNSSTGIARSLGMSETLIGLTIVAIGTSLPEIITSVTAALKKQSDIALGNIVGSNIFNILFVLGLPSLITPIAVDARMFTDMLVMIGFTLLLFIFSRTGYRIAKSEGIVLVAVYLIYTVYIIMRN